LLLADLFRYTLSDALAVGVWLNIFVRQAKYLGMANIAQSVNVISPLMTSKKGIVKQTTWYPLLLFCKYMHGHTIAVNVCCAEYEGPTQPDWIRGACETPWLDVSATVHEGMISVVVVNIHGEKDFKSDLHGVAAGKVQVYTVTGANLSVVNTAEKEEVSIKASSWDGKGTFTFPKHSLTMLRWKE
jgi:alpha-L-arabinofuranosidase